MAFRKQLNPVTACKRPSDLIKLALKDLAKAEKSPKHTIVMDTWHAFGGADKKCAVCFAGATMAFSLGLPPTQTASPFEIVNGLGVFDRQTSVRLGSLNLARAGYIGDFLEEFYQDSGDAKIVAARKKAVRAFKDNGSYRGVFGDNVIIKVPAYSRRSPKFKKAMLSIAKRLEKVGL